MTRRTGTYWPRPHRLTHRVYFYWYWAPFTLHITWRWRWGAWKYPMQGLLSPAHTQTVNVRRVYRWGPLEVWVLEP